jgi:hypothetical protein
MRPEDGHIDTLEINYPPCRVRSSPTPRRPQRHPETIKGWIRTNVKATAAYASRPVRVNGRHGFNLCSK